MRAIRIHAAGDVRFESVARPSPAADEVLIKVKVAGLCGSDAALFRNGLGMVPPEQDPRWPCVLGHEIAGEVVERGEAVDNLKLGTLVASGAGVSCEGCPACRAGRTNLCEKYWTAGIHRDGGLAEYVAIAANTCEPTEPHGVKGDDAALAQPMAVAVHGVNTGRLRAGERALIIGAGGIGGFAAWVACQLGAEVTVYDRDPIRLEVANRLGAAMTMIADGRPLAQRLRAEDPFDVVYETSSAAEALIGAIDLVRPGGRVVVIGIHAPVAVNFQRLTIHEVEVLGSMAHVCAVDLPLALDMVAARKENWSDLAPEVLSLEEVVETGLPDLVAGTSPRIKTLADPASLELRPYCV